MGSSRGNTALPCPPVVAELLCPCGKVSNEQTNDKTEQAECENSQKPTNFALRHHERSAKIGQLFSEHFPVRIRRVGICGNEQQVSAESVAVDRPLDSQAMKRQHVTAPFSLGINFPGKSEKWRQDQLPLAVIDDEPVFEKLGKKQGNHEVEAEPKNPCENSPGGKNVQRNNQPPWSEGE